MFQCYFQFCCKRGENVLVGLMRKQVAKSCYFMHKSFPPFFDYYVILSYTLELCTFLESEERHYVAPLGWIAFIRGDVVEM